MNYLIKYTNQNGKELEVVYAARSKEQAEENFNMLTGYRNADSIISIELID